MYLLILNSRHTHKCILVFPHMLMDPGYLPYLLMLVQCYFHKHLLLQGLLVLLLLTNILLSNYHQLEPLALSLNLLCKYRSNQQLYYHHKRYIYMSKLHFPHMLQDLESP